MNEQDRKRVLELIQDPPSGSKLAAAREYGIDLTLFLRSLELSPEERLRELDEAQAVLEQLRRAVPRDLGAVIEREALAELEEIAGEAAPGNSGKKQ